MPAAKTKDDLLTACEIEFSKLSQSLAKVDDELALRDFDGSTIKDVIGHRAYWIDLWLGWEADGRDGRPVHMPAEGFNWGQLKALNAGVRDAQSGLSWEDAKALLQDRHAALIKRLSEMSDAALYGAPMVGGNGKWTAGRYAESAGSSHYRSANKFVRSCLRAAAS